jgi:hypothetical protein
MTDGTLQYTFQYLYITIKVTRSKTLKFITGYAYYFTTALWINFSRHLLRAETNYLRCHSVKAHNTSWGFTLVISIVTFRAVFICYVIQQQLQIKESIWRMFRGNNDKTEDLGVKHIPGPLIRPQILHGRTLDWTLAFAVTVQRLSVWTMARLSAGFN